MKIKLLNVFNLEVEIIGGKIGDVEIKGLLRENISFKNKYNLQKLLKRVSEEKENYSTAEINLFKSYNAKEKDGQLHIEPFLEDGSQNPEIDKLNKEIQELLNEEIEIDVKFDIDDFNFQSESIYPTFMLSAFD
jgi:carbonic anhydrase